MPTIHFTPNLRRHFDTASREADGATVREALKVLFAEAPQIRTYLLDDQGRLRKHVNIFVDGVPVSDRARLTDPVGAAGEIFIFQALSGG